MHSQISNVAQRRILHETFPKVRLVSNRIVSGATIFSERVIIQYVLIWYWYDMYLIVFVSWFTVTIYILYDYVYIYIYVFYINSKTV